MSIVFWKVFKKKDNKKNHIKKNNKQRNNFIVKKESNQRKPSPINFHIKTPLSRYNHYNIKTYYVNDFLL